MTKLVLFVLTSVLGSTFVDTTVDPAEGIDGPVCESTEAPAQLDRGEAAAKCPIPDQCRKDSDCTGTCGGPGECIKANSCYRTCACAQ